MKFAYADPPYLGQGKKLYGAPEWDDPGSHYALISKLSDYYPDGWALSCSTPSLRTLLQYTPIDCRVGAWVKPFAVFKPNVNPAYAWEPIIFRGGRKRSRAEPTIRDWFSCNIALKKGLVGAKPPEVCEWIISLLGARRGEDRFDDLFPGAGIFTRTWNQT